MFSILLTIKSNFIMTSLQDVCIFHVVLFSLVQTLFLLKVFKCFLCLEMWSKIHIVWQYKKKLYIKFFSVPFPPGCALCIWITHEPNLLHWQKHLLNHKNQYSLASTRINQTTLQKTNTPSWSCKGSHDPPEGHLDQDYINCQ